MATSSWDWGASAKLMLLQLALPFKRGEVYTEK